MRGGALAQLVEQWTENPCVPGSIPGGTTFLKALCKEGFFYFSCCKIPFLLLLLVGGRIK